MKAFKNLLGKKVRSYIRNEEPKSISVHTPVPVFKAYEPDGKFYFCIVARLNETEIKLDVLSTKDSENGWRFQLGLQDIKYGSVPLTSIATVDVILSDCHVSGSISINYNGAKYSATNLFDRRETNILGQGIDFYNESAKHDLFNYYARYEGENIWLNHCTNDAHLALSPADYVRITHMLKDNAIGFYVGEEKIAQISSQIFPWEPRYVGWVLDSYQSVIPFLAVRLVIDWFQFQV